MEWGVHQKRIQLGGVYQSEPISLRELCITKATGIDFQDRSLNPNHRTRSIPVTHPLFSIFIPTYNRAGTLPRALESVASQQFKDFELIVVDDGSEDDTRKLVEQWKQRFGDRLRYLWQKNQGKHVAYNLAAREAKGVLMVLLDSDDPLC